MSLYGLELIEAPIELIESLLGALRDIFRQTGTVHRRPFRDWPWSILIRRDIRDCDQIVSNISKTCKDLREWGHNQILAMPKYGKDSVLQLTMFILVYNYSQPLKNLSAYSFVDDITRTTAPIINDA